MFTIRHAEVPDWQVTHAIRQQIGQMPGIQPVQGCFFFIGCGAGNCPQSRKAGQQIFKQLRLGKADFVLRPLLFSFAPGTEKVYAIVDVTDALA
jgi:hypothetical protein